MGIITHKNSWIAAGLLALLGWGLPCLSVAQHVNQPFETQDWVQPYPPFKIVGNLYYVGTHDLACYLVVTNKGHILINTGLAGSLSMIRQSIEDLGFKYADIKILLTNQAHFDHVGAIAAIQKETHARFFANAADAEVCRSGGATDYELSHHGVSFQPIQPDSLLNDKGTVGLGNVRIQLLHHPGHTKGSSSYRIDMKDGSRTYRVFIANIPSIITDRKFADITAYPGIKEDYAYTLSEMEKLDFDIWLAAHASQFKLHEKRKKGDPYNPEVFRDKEGYKAAIKQARDAFNRHE